MFKRATVTPELDRRVTQVPVINSFKCKTMEPEEAKPMGQLSRPFSISCQDPKNR